ncbi:MAG: PilZ domain-containing protein [Sphingobium sp.]
MSLFANLNHVIRSRDPAVDKRRAARDLVDMVSHVTLAGRTQGVRIINISSLGLMCRSDAVLPVGERLTIWLPVVKDLTADVRWVADGRLGMEFLTPIDPRIYDAMLALIPPRRTAW